MGHAPSFPDVARRAATVRELQFCKPDMTRSFLDFAPFRSSARGSGDTDRGVDPASIGLVTLEVKQLRERVNHLAVEMFHLTAEVEELLKQLKGRPPLASDEASPVHTDSAELGLEAFPSERPHPVPRRPPSQPVPTGAADLVSTAPVVAVSRRSASAAKAARVSGATGLASLLLIGLVGLSGLIRVDDRSNAVTAAAAVSGPAPMADHVVGTTERGEVALRASASSTAMPDASSHLGVARSGVGLDVIDRELVGHSATFEAGVQAVFWTHVVGGRPGDEIRHVWLHEDRQVASIRLPVGSPSWRTYSRQTLGVGCAGNWTVELRDAQGRLVTRRHFRCDRSPDQF